MLVNNLVVLSNHSFLVCSCLYIQFHPCITAMCCVKTFRFWRTFPFLRIANCWLSNYFRLDVAAVFCHSLSPVLSKLWTRDRNKHFSKTHLNDRTSKGISGVQVLSASGWGFSYDCTIEWIFICMPWNSDTYRYIKDWIFGYCTLFVSAQGSRKLQSHNLELSTMMNGETFQQMNFYIMPNCLTSSLDISREVLYTRDKIDTKLVGKCSTHEIGLTWS